MQFCTACNIVFSLKEVFAVIGRVVGLTQVAVRSDPAGRAGTSTGQEVTVSPVQAVTLLSALHPIEPLRTGCKNAHRFTTILRDTAWQVTNTWRQCAKLSFCNPELQSTVLQPLVFSSFGTKIYDPVTQSWDAVTRKMVWILSCVLKAPSFKS